jgi:hypothetical protein
VVYQLVDGQIVRLLTEDGQDSFMLGEMEISD